MELIDVIDSKNNKTNRKEEKTIIHRDGLWHREVIAWIINGNYDLLIQKRASNKKQLPNKWGCTAGHIIAGEEVEDAIIREVKEELGLKVEKKDLELLRVTPLSKKYSESQNNNYYEYAFLIKTNNNIEEYIIRKEELSEIKYITIEELEEKIKNKDTSIVDGMYEPWYAELVQKILQDIKERRTKNKEVI